MKLSILIGHCMALQTLRKKHVNMWRILSPWACSMCHTGCLPSSTSPCLTKHRKNLKIKKCLEKWSCVTKSQTGSSSVWIALSLCFGASATSVITATQMESMRANSTRMLWSVTLFLCCSRSILESSCFLQFSKSENQSNMSIPRRWVYMRYLLGYTWQAS